MVGGEKVRDIIFRGKDFNNKWLYGSLNRFTNDEDYIQYEDGEDMVGNAVHMDTVGQFTGLLDNSGNKIFEGDIIEFQYLYMSKCRDYVVYSNELGAFILAKHGNLAYVFASKCKVLGNRFDNPELLELGGGK